MTGLFQKLRFAALALTALAAGCSHAAKDEVPTLHVADQLGYVEAVLSAAGEDKPTNYRIEWSNFVGGPPVIAAETGGSVDVGWMAETPLVFAQAAGSPVKVVAVSRGTKPGSANIALVVAAGSPFKSIADLKGKKIGYMQGTVAQYLIVRLLDGVGLKPTDITSVRITSYNTGIVERGVVDALVTAEPLLSQGLADGKVRVLAYGGQPYTPGFNYLVASDAALADPKRTKLIGDFVQRMARATLWIHANVDKAAPFVAKSFKVSPELATGILRRTPAQYTPVDGAIIAEQQRETDLFQKLGLISRKIDAARLFDNRYDKLVAQMETKQ